MKVLLLSVTVVSSLLMVCVILLQQGKGAGLGSAFGGGARGGLYESSGGSNPLSKLTAILATIFLASSLALSLYIGEDASVLEELQQTETSIPGNEATDTASESTDAGIPAGNTESETSSDTEKAATIPE